MPFLRQFDELLIRPHSATTWQLVEDLVYKGQDQLFTIPAGYVTDFATVPPFMRWLVETYGPYTRAAIVHDWLISEEIPARRVTSRDADGIFRRIMREEGTPMFKRWIMWAAVRVAAQFNHGRSYGRKFYRDLPAILAVGAPALVLIGPAALLVLVTRALLKPLSWIK